MARRFQRRGKWETRARPAGTPEVLTQTLQALVSKSMLRRFLNRRRFAPGEWLRHLRHGCHQTLRVFVARIG